MQVLDQALACFGAVGGLVLDCISEAPRNAYEVVSSVSGREIPFYVRHMSLAGALCVLERFVESGDCVAVDDADGSRRFNAGRSVSGSVG